MDLKQIYKLSILHVHKSLLRIYKFVSFVDTLQQNSSTEAPSDLTWRLRKVLSSTRKKLPNSKRLYLKMAEMSRIRVAETMPIYVA